MLEVRVECDGRDCNNSIVIKNRKTISSKTVVAKCHKHGYAVTKEGTYLCPDCKMISKEESYDE